MMPDSRELATAILVAVCVVVVLAVPSVRRQVPAVVRAAFVPRLAAVWVVYVAYALLVVAGASRIGLWRWSMAWDTGVVVFFVGLPAVGRSFAAKRVGDVWHIVFADLAGVSALAGLYVNFSSFGLVAELVLQTVATVSAVLRAYAARSPEFSPVRRICDVVLAGLGLVMVGHTTATLMSGMPLSGWIDLGLTAALAVWFPVSLSPMIYVCSYVSATEQAALRVRWAGRGRPPLPIGLIFRLLIAFRLRISRAAGFSHDWARQFAEAGEGQPSRSVLKRYRATLAAGGHQSVGVSP